MPASRVIAALFSLAVRALRAVAAAWAAGSPEARNSMIASGVPAASAAAAASRTSNSAERSAMSATSARGRGSPVSWTPVSPSHFFSAGVKVPGVKDVPPSLGSRNACATATSSADTAAGAVAAEAGAACRTPASRARDIAGASSARVTLIWTTVSPSPVKST